MKYHSIRPLRFAAILIILLLASSALQPQVKKTGPDDKTPVEVKSPDVIKTEGKEKPEVPDGKKAVEKTKKTRYFTLNFKDVDISEFLNVMSQLIQKNIVIDDKVKGKITITSAKRVPVDQAYDIMKSILEVKGFAVVETENLIKVIPIKDAIKKNVEIIVDQKKLLPSDSDKTITYLLEVQHADANEIANVLRSLKSAFTDIVIYPSLNMIILSGNSSEINGLIKIVRSLDRELDTLKDEKVARGNIHVVHLENADAEQLAGVLSRIPFSETAKIDTTPTTPKETIQQSRKTARVTGTQPTAPTAKTQQKLSIIANKDTNSLIITASPEEFKEILRIIKELDIVREQVLIEALIVEVSAENGWGFGIDWMLGGQSGQHLYGGSSIMGGAPNYGTPEGLAGKTLALPLSPGFQLGYLNDRSILSYILLNASGTDKNFNILSTPQILTVDNQEAELNVGEEIPVPTNNRISDTGVQFYTFEYKPVGVKLKITPHITKEDEITLDLYQEVNSVLGQTTVSVSGTIIPPKLGKRDIKTKVTVMDGRTIVVGGLIRNEKTIEETKVPVLGDIPLLGWFFKRKTVQYSKTNLLVFITPHVVTKKEKLESITRQKREEQRRLRQR
ncbi:MAG TPA: type II secretion system protein GspD [Spirochaetes bacterium]|nr:type II secretion system protein GspD [Spirochaetota bacterium]